MSEWTTVQLCDDTFEAKRTSGTLHFQTDNLDCFVIEEGLRLNPGEEKKPNTVIIYIKGKKFRVREEDFNKSLGV